MLGTVLPVFNRLWQRYDLELLVVGSMAPICQQQIEAFRTDHPEAADRYKWLVRCATTICPRIFNRPTCWCIRGWVTGVLMSWPKRWPAAYRSSVARGAEPLSWSAKAPAWSFQLDDGPMAKIHSAARLRASKLCSSDLSTFKQQARKHAERALDLRIVAGADSQNHEISHSRRVTSLFRC